MQNPQRKLFDSGDWALAQQGAQPTDDAHILYGSPPSEGHGPMLHKPTDSASQAPSNLGGRDSPSVTTPRQVAAVTQPALDGCAGAAKSPLIISCIQRQSDKMVCSLVLGCDVVGGSRQLLRLCLLHSTSGADELLAVAG